MGRRERHISLVAFVQGGCVIGLLLGIPGVEQFAGTEFEVARADTRIQVQETIDSRASLRYPNTKTREQIGAMTEAESNLYLERQKIEDSLQILKKPVPEPLPDAKQVDTFGRDANPEADQGEFEEQTATEIIRPGIRTQ